MRLGSLLGALGLGAVVIPAEQVGSQPLSEAWWNLASARFPRRTRTARSYSDSTSSRVAARERTSRRCR
jgi:hypothetical protein